MAAGASRRLGQPKQLVQIDGEPLLRRQCRTALAANLGPIVVILGCRAGECLRAIIDLPVDTRTNERWAEGLSTSIRMAAQLALTAGVNGLLLLHADQYRVTVADLEALHLAWTESGRLAACVSTRGEDFGPPVIFPPHCFADLLTLSGDVGARGVLAKLPLASIQRVPIANAFVDLDSPEDAAPLSRGRG